MSTDNLIRLEHSSAASARISELRERHDLIMRDQSDAVARREARRVVRHCLSRFLLGLALGAGAGLLVMEVVL